MLAHEYSWHDAVYLADSSDGCGAANIDSQKAQQIPKEDSKSWLFLFLLHTLPLVTEPRNLMNQV